MHLSWRGWLRVILLIVIAVLIWLRFFPHRRPIVTTPAAAPGTIPGQSADSSLNQPGGGPAPAEAYEVYSALYQLPMQEPLVFSEDSVTDIPQVGGSCLKPSSPDQRQLSDAFNAANRQSRRWQQQFSIPAGYRLVSRKEAGHIQSCLESHGQDTARCGAYKDVRNVRFLGVPAFDSTHTHALVSVIKMCGGFCGSGGIFEVEKKDGAWQRSPTTDFTRDCSWMY